MKTISAHTKRFDFKDFNFNLAIPPLISFSLSEAFQAYQNGNISLFVIAMSAFCLTAAAL